MRRPPRLARSLRNFFVLSALLAFAAAPARAQQPGAAASAHDPAAPREVRLTLTVSNERGSYIRGVEREHVEVFEGKAAREIRSFGPAEEHASVGVLFDISASMRAGAGGKLEAARQVFARFVQQSSPANEYFIRAFKKDEIELADWTRDREAIRAALDKIAPAVVPKDGDGGTALYDACASALAKLAGGSHRRRVLLIFTDGGQDNYSRRRLKELKRMVRGSEVLLYSVALFERHDPGVLDVAGQADLDELVSASGGVAYFTHAGSEAVAAADRIAAELRNQYVVVFAPADAAKKGELNKVRVRIKPPAGYKESLRVRAREGYPTP